MSGYPDSPRLGLYQPGKLADITAEHGDALAAWRAEPGCSRQRNSRFFTTSMHR